MADPQYFHIRKIFYGEDRTSLNSLKFYDCFFVLRLSLKTIHFPCYRESQRDNLAGKISNIVAKDCIGRSNRFSNAMPQWSTGSIYRRIIAIQRYITRKPGQRTFSLNVHRPINQLYFALFAAFVRP